MDSPQRFFSNAQNFEMRNTRINNINGENAVCNIVSVDMKNSDAVATILWPHVAAGAIFDSAARYAAGKCHPGTRKKIIERIFNWINNPDPATERMLWLYGAAGAGKSAIAHTICECLQQDNPDWFGGSFFFEFGPTDRGNAHKLFSTLSYQLAIRIPSIRTEINGLLSHDPSLSTKSMEIQLVSLIVEPLLRCQSFLSHPPTFIIDGLDECADDEGLNVQRNIVALIAKFIVDYDLPLRVIIASRPEYWIRNAFDTSPLPPITLPLSLRDDLDADADIRVYLTEEFEKIYMENKQIMSSVVPPWPPTKVVNQFVEEADGQYIYAATVLKFVGSFSRFSNPQKQLEIITSPGPHRTLAFSGLGRLYATIVSAYPHWETMKRVLSGILVGANTSILKVVLHVNSDELILVLRALSSLIDIRNFEFPQPKFKSGSPSDILETLFGNFEEEDTLAFSHRSFQEFLLDKTHSGVFHIDLAASDSVPNDIVQGVFKMIHTNIDEKYEIEPHHFWNIGFSTYHYMLRNVTNQSARHCGIDTLLNLITTMTNKIEPLFETSTWTYIRSLFHFGCEMEGLIVGLLSTFNDTIYNLRKDKEDRDMLDKFRHTSHRCARVISQACRRARLALSSCTNFEVTPALVYLTEYSQISLLPMYGLVNIAGVADWISALRQYYYILPLPRVTPIILGLDPFHFQWIFLNDENDSNKPAEALSKSPQPLSWSTGTINILFRANEESDWCTQGAWRDLRILFACKSLELLQGTETCDPWVLSSVLSHDQLVTLARFFWSSISDISDKKYFQNPSNIAILEIMTNTDSLVCQKLHFMGEPFIASILCWFHRQLTNPKTKKLLHEHDKNLEQSMTITMKFIFEHAFVEVIAKSEKEGVSFRGENYLGRVGYIAIKVNPLPQGYNVEEIAFPGHCWEPYDWLPFHVEVFAKVATNTETSSTGPIIDPSYWHPYFVSRILKRLALYLYNRNRDTRPLEPGYRSHENSLFPYIIHCLPYAQPTLDNLNTLRAIVYLYPCLSYPWDPPEGLWSSLVEFLQKYDRSVLSSEELDLFVRWLNSTEHTDIKTYVV